LTIHAVTWRKEVTECVLVQALPVRRFLAFDRRARLTRNANAEIIYRTEIAIVAGSCYRPVHTAGIRFASVVSTWIAVVARHAQAWVLDTDTILATVSAFNVTKVVPANPFNTDTRTLVVAERLVVQAFAARRCNALHPLTDMTSLVSLPVAVVVDLVPADLKVLLAVPLETDAARRAVLVLLAFDLTVVLAIAVQKNWQQEKNGHKKTTRAAPSIHLDFLPPVTSYSTRNTSEN